MQTPVDPSVKILWLSNIKNTIKNTAKNDHQPTVHTELNSGNLDVACFACAVSLLSM